LQKAKANLLHHLRQRTGRKLDVTETKCGALNGMDRDVVLHGKPLQNCLKSVARHDKSGATHRAILLITDKKGGTQNEKTDPRTSYLGVGICVSGGM